MSGTAWKGRGTHYRRTQQTNIVDGQEKFRTLQTRKGVLQFLLFLLLIAIILILFALA